MANAIKKCACCGKEFELPCKVEEYTWQLSKKFYCGYKCYSKVFDSKYKAARNTSRIRLGYKTDKTLR